MAVVKICRLTLVVVVNPETCTCTEVPEAGLGKMTPCRPPGVGEIPGVLVRVAVEVGGTGLFVGVKVEVEVGRTGVFVRVEVGVKEAVGGTGVFVLVFVGVEVLVEVAVGGTGVLV
jgi:hypothetical protein